MNIGNGKIDLKEGRVYEIRSEEMGIDDRNINKYMEVPTSIPVRIGKRKRERRGEEIRGMWDEI